MDGRQLRTATAADAAAIAEIYRPYVEKTAITFEETPPDEAEIATRIEETTETYPWFVAETEDGIVGYAYAGELRKRAAYRWVTELSVYVDRTRQGEGFGSALYRALLATLERQGYESAYGVITLPNPGSVAFHERFGFKQVALLPDAGYKHDEWYDVVWYERPLGERSETPTAPTPFSDCRDAEWVQAALSTALDSYSPL